MHKTVGILGGMGPYATSMFFKKILDLTPAKKDWDHLRIVIDNNPHIPSRTRHFLFDEASPVQGMIDTCIKLQDYPVDLIAIPCNSACYYIDEVVEKIDIPVLNIIKETVDAVARNYQGNQRCIVLGGRLTYETRSYKKYLEENNLVYIHHDESIQADVENLIENVKINNMNDMTFDKYISIANVIDEKYGIDILIHGCTELLYFSHNFEKFSVIDSSNELAMSVIKYAKEIENI